MLLEELCNQLSASGLAALNRRPSSDQQSEGPSLFELYCAPRKALFEEALWDSVETTAQGMNNRPRELLELHPDRITFMPATKREASGLEREA
jgi:hypothetical protein